MNQGTVDVLMVTYNRPYYTSLALKRLLDTADESVRVWIWHNGEDRETWEVVRSLREHPRVHRVNRSLENRRLNEPTNWVWREGQGEYLSKVDDDCLVPHGWLETLRAAHQEVPELGIVGCWRFLEEDFMPGLARRKIRSFGRHQVLLNCWVEGSGYLMKRACVEKVGLLRPQDSFTDFCFEVARQGWVNGWYFPFLFQDHFDDPRSPHTLLKTDQDLRRHMPLSALNNGVSTLKQWEAQLRRSALVVQQASPDPRHHGGWRKRARLVRWRLRRVFGSAGQW